MNYELFKNFHTINLISQNPCNSYYDINESYLENNNFTPIFQNPKINNNIIEYFSDDIREKVNQEPFDEKIYPYTDKPYTGTKTSSLKDKSSFDYDIFKNNIDNLTIYNKNNNQSSKEESLNSNQINKPIDKKKKGRKPKNITDSYSIHTSFSNDTIIRKCKNLILISCLGFLNYQIKKIYNGDIGQGIYTKKLVDIGREQKADNTINFMRKFLSKTLKEIFSANISLKFTSILENHNAIIIQRALNDKDEEKRNKFNRLFNITFRDCLHKFIGNDEFVGVDNFNNFEGFQTFEEIKEKLDEDNENLNAIKEYLKNFEIILENTRPRAVRHKNKIK